MRDMRVPRLPLAGISVLALFAAASVTGALAGTGASIMPGGKMVVVKSGHWARIAWTFSASDTADGHVCLFLTLPAQRAGGSSCGLVRRSPTRAGGSYGVAFTSGYQGVSYDIGAVFSTARTVKVTLSNGSVIKTPTIHPPRGLAGNLDFFAVERPCAAFETSIVARDAAGQVVATWTASRARNARHPDC
jgi:hypothetical protein